MNPLAATIRTLIVDDEVLARQNVEALLRHDADIAIVAQCNNGPQAVEAIKQHRPDLLFLDVEMPGMSGFEVLAKLPTALIPQIVFVTAYDHFALQAFEVHAVDYLLKPFDRERFRKALHRATERLRTSRPDDLSNQLNAVLAQLQPKPGPSLDRIPVKSGGRVTLVNAADVDWVGSADNYVELHVGTQTHLIRETLTAMEQRLPANRFVRISRTSIVNAERVRELQPLFHGEYSVTLKDGTRLTLSRTYRDQLPRLGIK